MKNPLLMYIDCKPQIFLSRAKAMKNIGALASNTLHRLPNILHRLPDEEYWRQWQFWSLAIYLHQQRILRDFQEALLRYKKHNVSLLPGLEWTSSEHSLFSPLFSIWSRSVTLSFLSSPLKGCVLRGSLFPTETSNICATSSLRSIKQSHLSCEFIPWSSLRRGTGPNEKWPLTGLH